MSRRAWELSTGSVELPGVSATSAPPDRRPGGWWVISDPATRRRSRQQAELVPAGAGRRALSASLGGRLFHGYLAEGRRREGGGAVDGGLTAQFPGKIRKLLVAPGDRVEKGAPLLLVEAMKMEFAVRAPAAGAIQQILVREGQQIQPGDRFIEMEVSG